MSFMNLIIASWFLLREAEGLNRFARARFCVVLLVAPSPFFRPLGVLGLLFLKTLHGGRLPLLDVAGRFFSSLDVVVALHPVLLDLATCHRGPGALRLFASARA